MKIEALTPYIYAFLALFGVILLIFVVTWVLKRVSGLSTFMMKDTGEIQIQAIKQIDPKSKLMVVKWRRGSYLIALGEGGVNFIGKDDMPHKEETHVAA